MAFPTVTSITATTFNTPATSHAVAMPATTVSGELLIILFANDGNIAQTTPSGWTLLNAATGSDPTLSAFAKIADGTEGGTTVSITVASSTAAVAQVYRITAWYGTISTGVDKPAGNWGHATIQNFNPTTMTPSWGTDDNLYIVGLANSSTVTVTTAPSTYTNLTETNEGVGTAGAALFSARKAVNAASDNPGAWAASASATWAVFGLIIRPAPAFTTVTPSAITSEEAFGTAKINQVIGASGIASLEAFGGATVAPQAFTITPAGIASLEQFGSPVVAPGAFTVSPSGISSEEAFGGPAILQVQAVQVSGIASAEQFGAPVISLGAFTVSPSGVASAEAVGTPTLTMYVFPSGIASLEAFGTATLRLTVTATGIASLEAFGTAYVNAIQKVLPSGISSLEAFGTLSLYVIQSVSPAGISSLEAFGTALLRMTITTSGIATGEAFGTASVQKYVQPSGIASGEVFGSPTMVLGAVTIRPQGIASAEQFGETVVYFAVTFGIAPPPGVSDISVGGPGMSFDFSISPGTSDAGTMPPGVS